MIKHLKKSHRKFRLRKEVLSFEELIWLVIGILAGWFVAKGASVILLVIVFAICVAFVYEEFYFRKYGTFNVFGERVKKK